MVICNGTISRSKMKPNRKSNLTSLGLGRDIHCIREGCVRILSAKNEGIGLIPVKM